MKIQLARWLSLASYLGLIAWLMVWIIFLDAVEEKHISIWLLLFVSPLLFPLRGVLAGRDKALVWGTLVSLLYAVHGGMVAWSNTDNNWYGLLEAGLSVLYVLGASYFIRWRAMAQQAP